GYTQTAKGELVLRDRPLRVHGAARLAGGLDLAALTSDGRPGARVTVIDHRGKGRTAGTFTGLPEGAEVRPAEHTYRISYRGGDGNDVVLTRVKAHRAPSAVSTAGAGAVETRTRTLSASADSGLGWWPYALALGGLCGLLVPVARRRGKDRRRGGRHAAAG
ncbi:autotransporter, partial [Streptomyces sp. ND04-05B]|nr:autotransporter [Streptomyces sp. ND04-05B]